LTIWTGVSGHGKTLLLGQVILMAACYGYKCAVGSFEMFPKQTLGRMIRQFTTKWQPPQIEIENAMNWLSGKIWIYNVLGNVPSKKLLELMNYSCRRHGVTHFAIDSLMKISVCSDDYEAQRVFMNDVVGFAKENNVHVHLVAHTRKPKSEGDIAGKSEIKGSSDIYNQADNVLTVWRNKEKEERCFNGHAYDTREPDVVTFCDKQREGGWEGKLPMWHIKTCGQIVNKQDGQITPIRMWMAKEKAEKAVQQRYAEVE
jgi:twinkle protein